MTTASTTRDGLSESEIAVLTSLAKRLADPIRHVGDLHMDRASYRVFVCGRPVSLTEFEFAVLWVLATSPGVAMSRAEIHALAVRVIGREPERYDGEARSIDVHVSKVRRAIGAGRIATISRFGYRLDP